MCSPASCLQLPSSLLPHWACAVLQMDRVLRIRQGNTVLIKGELDLFWHAEADLPEIGLVHPHPDDKIDTAVTQVRDAMVKSTRRVGVTE